MTDIETARREMAELREKEAYFRGRVDAAIDDALADPEQIELLRAMAWHRTGANLSLSKDGKVAGAPEGWPDGVDRDQFVADWAENFRAKYSFGSDEAAPPPAASPGVSRFRERLGS